jgi:hypothetical protein
MPSSPPSVGQIVLYRKNNRTYPAIVTATQAQTRSARLDSDQHVHLGVFAADYAQEYNIALGSEYQDDTYFYPVGV